MKIRSIAFALLAGTTLLPGATVSERLDRLESKVSGMADLLNDLARIPSVQPFGRSKKTRSVGHYQLRKGDCYWSIARRHKVSVSDLERANPGVNPLTLSIGKKIIIPGRRRTTTITNRTGSKTYQVKQGDILGRISEAHDIRLYQLLDANPGLNPRRLKIGTILTIPGPPNRAVVTLAEPSPVKAPVEEIPSKDEPTSGPPTKSRPNPYLKDIAESAPEVRMLKRESPPIPLEEPQLITVNEDRRLSEIAEQHKTTVATINKLNKRDLSPRQMIKEGSQLYMPAR
ncbi:MAG: LysM repeat protein [Akkermansiaceae bacterium]|jgi:LysM repeat protein